MVDRGTGYVTGNVITVDVDDSLVTLTFTDSIANGIIDDGELVAPAIPNGYYVGSVESWTTGAPASIFSVRSERSHKLAVRRIRPDFTRTVPPSPPRSPQSSMACCKAAVALLLLVALYGGEDTSHSFPDFHPSLRTARAAPGTGCERMLDPKGPLPGGDDASVLRTEAKAKAMSRRCVVFLLIFIDPVSGQCG